ncbi:MAG TPA: M50 family metallopeptidase [Polyangia bacterium]|nr:M50 family metallopeptidase [Polyangia bacterium]
MQFYLLAFLAIIALIVIHEAGHFWVARMCHMRVEKFSIFFGPAIASFKHKGTVFQIGTIPLGGFVQITGMNPMEEHDANDPFVYPNRPAWQRFLTILAGPWMNYIAAVVIVFTVFLVWGIPQLSKTQQVSEVLAGSPAAGAGLQPGDVMVSVAGEPVNVDHPAPEILDRAAGRPVEVVVRREQAVRTFTLSANRDKEGHYRIGVALRAVEEYRRATVVAALKESLVFPVVSTYGIAMGLFDMARGKQKADVSGPIQITYQLGKQIKKGAREALGIIANLSIFLGFFNLLPVPALDGGRLAFLTYELVTRRRVNQRVEQGVHMIGAVLLMGLIVLIMFKDVRQLFTHGG